MDLDLNSIWSELEDIFSVQRRNLNSSDFHRLERLGFIVKKNKGGHPKLYFNVNGKTLIVTMCTSASDCYAKRQMLRRIKNLYKEAKEKK